MQNAKDKKAEITARVWSIIDALPQRAAIESADARAWVDDVVGRYGDLAAWHATRAGGFGGSQIGALVRNFSGQRADHEQSAHDIVAGALLRKTPDEPNGHMRRGIAMEDQHRRWFYEKYGAVRDERGFKLLSKGVGSRAWMRYSPDDLVLMAAPGQTQIQRYLIDFKAPSNVDAAEAVAFQYACQLHMGSRVCEHNGISVDAMLLSQFDWAGWQLKDDLVDQIEGLNELIESAGDHYWAYVLRGEVPPYVRKERIGDEADLQKQLNEPALRLARLKAIVTALEKRVKLVEQEVKPVVEKLHFGTSKLQLSGIAYSAVAVLDEEQIRASLPEEVILSLPLKASSTKQYDGTKMAAAMREAGLDTKPFLLPGNFDPQAVYDALVLHDVDADSLYTEQIRSKVDTKLAEQVSAWVDRTFAELITKPTDPAQVDQNTEQAASQAEEALAAAMAPTNTNSANPAIGEGPSNDRPGHESSRHVQRSVSA